MLLFADDMGYGDLSCMGSPDVKTPHIDEIYSNGLNFTQAYVSAPQCSPSRAGLMTGQYQQRFGHEANPEKAFIQQFGLDKSQKTFAKFMKDAGYRTLGFGKWDLGSIQSAVPWTRGFDHYYGHYAGARSFYVQPNEKDYQGMHRAYKDVRQDQGYLTDMITQDAINNLTRDKDGEPWFAYMSYLNPHWPMEPKPEDLKEFSHIKDVHRRLFLALMKNMDDSVGALIQHLKDTGQYDNTVVIFLSDNGGPTGQPRAMPNDTLQYGKNTSVNFPFKGVKGQVFEGGIRTPMFIQWPQTFTKSNYNAPVISLDLLPTCVALTQGKIDRKIDGVNLLPYINQKLKGKPHKNLYWRWFNNWAIRRGKWKLVIVDHNKRFLYDLSKDKGETTNLRGSNPDIYNSLLTDLKQWNNELQPAKWRNPAQVQMLSRKLE